LEYKIYVERCTSYFITGEPVFIGKHNQRNVITIIKTKNGECVREKVVGEGGMEGDFPCQDNLGH
jgi:hypothetical protein